MVLNPQKPRSKSFEVILVEGEKGNDVQGCICVKCLISFLLFNPLLSSPTEVCLWSGIKKGPPRKLKFPEPEVVVSALEKALKTE